MTTRALGVGIVLADQASKAAATAPITNDHFALGVAGAPVTASVAVMTVALLIMGAVAVRQSAQGVLPPWVPALLISGATSNLVDRMLLGAVRDFIAVGPVVLNVADLALLVGVAGFLFFQLKGGDPCPSIASAATRSEPSC